jgi:DNA-binding NarL/FixJ family response regulator
MSESSATILIVDDTSAILALLYEQLEQNNFSVMVAESGVSALQRIRRLKPDLILLDVLMPNLDGFETCRRLKADPATQEIPVIFMTGLHDINEMVHGFAVGGVDYITKPLQMPEVLARIHTHLTIRQLQQQLQEQNELLEQRVHERTLALQAEISRRRQQEAEKQKLLDMVGKQSDQLRALTAWVIDSHHQHGVGLSATLRAQMTETLQIVHMHLDLINDTVARLDDQISRELIVYQTTNLRTSLAQLEEELGIFVVEINKPSPAAQEVMGNPLIKLSAREREVMQLIVDGKANAEIADLLYVSETTVRTYRSRILQKLELDDVTALIKFALKHRLTSL